MEKSIDFHSMELEKLQRAFQRFAPNKIVEEIIDRGISIHGEKREVTILFVDILGFTSLSERLPPERLVKVLNGYFERMTQAIVSHRGHISKFIGDGIMATFGSTETNPWQALDAVWAALAMRKRLREYNRELAEQRIPPLSIGIGIHKGMVIAGVFGSTERMEYTVVGDVVNTASRIEGLTRNFKTDILISESVRDSLDDRFEVEAFPPVAVKGKAEKIKTWTVKKFHEKKIGRGDGSFQ